MEFIFRSLKVKWNRSSVGLDMGAGERLTNLRFADDVLLMADSKKRMQSMLEDLSAESAKHGLHLHPDKSKVLTNFHGAASQRLKVLDMSIEILNPDASLKYLGRKLCMSGLHDEELSSRIRAGWATFTRHRHELTNKKYPLRCRLRLFEATVGAAVLYGCEAWTLKLDQQKRLRTTQRKMLRAILGMKRRVVQREGEDGNTDGTETASNDTDTTEDDLEAWSDSLKRTTRTAEDRLTAANQEEWVVCWRRRQWRWAGKLAGTNMNKWLQHAFRWCLPVHGRRGVYRAQGRPLKRWDTDLQDFTVQHALGTSWEQLAKNAEGWAELENFYVKWVLEKC